MKFWQLISVCRDLNVLAHLSNLPPKWAKYSSWYNNYSSIVNNQDRSILDHEVPNDLCRELIGLSTIQVYLSDGYIRKVALGHNDKILSTLDVYDNYGGEKLEDVFEAGLVEI